MKYRDLRTPQLQHLAASGDAAAAREIARRASSTAPAPDVTQLDYTDLAELRRGWQDGETADQRAHSFALALAAHQEMGFRRSTASRLGIAPGGERFFGPDPVVVPGLPGLAPWEVPLPPRCRSWQRPRGSTHYPDPVELERQRMSAMATDYYARLRARERAAGAPPKETM
jgi:hypothetical protein